MRLALTTALAVLLLTTSCSLVMEDNHKFEELANGFFEGFLPLNPEWATGLGDHRFDHLLSDYSIEGIEKEKQFYIAYIDSMTQIDPRRLNETNRIDYDILLNELRYNLFSLDTLRAYEWNPLMYNPAGSIYSLIARDFAPLTDRMKNVIKRLEAIPVRIEQAKANLGTPPKIHTETTIRQIQGAISLIRDDLNEHLDQLPELKDEFEPARNAAIRALEDYGQWLEKDVLPRADGAFRLGDENYRVKLRYTLHSDQPREEILRRAEEDLVKTQDEIYQTALPLFEKYFPENKADAGDKKKVIKAILDKLAEEHPSEENVVEFAEICLKMCDDFVR